MSPCAAEVSGLRLYYRCVSFLYGCCCASTPQNKTLLALDFELGSRFLHTTTRELHLNNSTTKTVAMCTSLGGDMSDAKVYYRRQSPPSRSRQNALLPITPINVTPVVAADLKPDFLLYASKNPRASLSGPHGADRCGGDVLEDGARWRSATLDATSTRI